MIYAATDLRAVILVAGEHRFGAVGKQCAPRALRLGLLEPLNGDEGQPRRLILLVRRPAGDPGRILLDDAVRRMSRNGKVLSRRD